MHRMWTAGIAILAATVVPAQSDSPAEFWIDPVRGATENPGSLERPWRTLEEVAASAKLEALPKGSILRLATGHHGRVTLRASDLEITSAGESDRPTLSRLVVESCAEVRIRSLTITPEGHSPYPGPIVSIQDAEDIQLDNCIVRSRTDHDGWTWKNWSTANDGIAADPASTRVGIRDTLVLNTRHAIALRANDSACTGNIIADYSGEGILASGDRTRVAGNVITNAWIAASAKPTSGRAICLESAEQEGASPLRFNVAANLVVGHTDPELELASQPCGIYCAPGPFRRCRIADNVVWIENEFGIFLVDAESCSIVNNACSAPGCASELPRIVLARGGQQPNANVAIGNVAHGFALRADPGLKSKNNTAPSTALFRKRFDACAATIVKQFGARHGLSDRARIPRSPD